MNHIAPSFYVFQLWSCGYFSFVIYNLDITSDGHQSAEINDSLGSL